ncbi:cyclic nucleotide-binding domain-containing protein [Cellvibrio sp. UBA7661]|uniref:cyclic nucleotide-binding domain-containing protein n=1 Tax=Cellvibrio sp. UBA7661 TaxID=1946311 RepID=UPI002F35A9D3
MAISLDVLASFAPFNTLNHEYIIQVAEKANLREVTKGTIIFKRGRPFPEKVYLVSGTVDLIDSGFQINTINPASESRRSPLNITQPTQVSAVAKSDVTLLSVDSDFLDLVLAWSESNDEEAETSGVSLHDDSDWMSSLLQSPLFSRLPPANIRQLFIRFKAQKVQADEIVIRQGERGDFFYVLESGSAIVMDTSDKILAALRPGQYFGEEALVGDTTRNATIKMITPGKVMKLDKEDFRELLQEPVLKYVTADELKARSDDMPAYQIIDVRLPVERRGESVPESRNIPLNQLRNHLKNLDETITYVVTDDSGRRCDVAAHLLAQAGFNSCILKDSAAHYAGL